MSSESPSLNSLLDRLPHQPPMRLLDGVLEATAARSVCVSKMDTRKAELFGDDRGGIRSSIGIELIAQTAALGLASLATAEQPRGGRLVMVRSFSCSQPSLETGADARTEAILEDPVDGSPFSIATGTVLQHDTLVCEATLLLMLAGPA